MTPAGPAFTAAAHLHAAETFRASQSQAQRNFAPTLEQWAANALTRGAAAERQLQQDLFA